LSIIFDLLAMSFSLLKKIRARRLSMRGDHAAALALAGDTDVKVLSRAGMHATVIHFAKKSSLEYALALATMGRIEESLAIVANHSLGKSARQLLGVLAVAAPNETLKFVQDNYFCDIRSYCQFVIGNVELDVVKLPPLLGLFVASSIEDSNLFKYFFGKSFSDFGVEPPLLELGEGMARVDINNLSSFSLYDEEKEDKNQPLVSIVMTSYNEERYLPTAIKSILAQSWKNIELILIDDGSTDNTHKIGLDFANMDGRVKAFRLENNSGTWSAKNFGLSKATGAYLTMHDADDWSHPEKIRRQTLSLISNPSYMCSSSYMFRIDETTGRPFSRNAASFLRWNPSSLMFRREALETIGDYLELLGADCEYVARIESRWGSKCHVRLKLPLSVGWKRPDSLSCRYRDFDGIERRLAHWESWRRLHANTHACKGPSGFDGNPFFSHH